MLPIIIAYKHTIYWLDRLKKLELPVPKVIYKGNHDYLMKEMKASELERGVLKLYTLVFCVDLMAEKGMKFKDIVVEVNENQVKRLNEVYEAMYSELMVNF